MFKKDHLLTIIGDDIMKTESYEIIDKLDLTLNGILHTPEIDRPEVGYTGLEKQIDVLIEAPTLRGPIQGVEKLADGLYSGKISTDYLKELASREDIEYIYSTPVSQVRF